MCSSLTASWKLQQRNDQNELLKSAVLTESLRHCFTRPPKKAWIIKKSANLERQSIPLVLPLSDTFDYILSVVVIEGTHTSKREIMTPLQPHLHLNADVCLQDAACHLYYCSRPIRVWVFGSVASKEERAPVHWINGVNNSLWRFSDYAQTESPHSTGRQTTTAQSKTSTQRQTSTLLKTSPQTLVNPACRSKPLKNCCRMHPETACGEVGHIQIYRMKRVTEICTHAHAHARMCKCVNHPAASLPRCLLPDDSSLIKRWPCRGKKHTLVHTSSHTVDTVNTIKPRVHWHRKHGRLPSLCTPIEE